jgi:beta-carotene hydroxylase
MLKFKADRRTLVYLVITTALFFVQWYYGFHWWLYASYLYFSVAVTVIAHNHNHVPMWKKDFLNDATDYWITLLYGFPSFIWTPTHNKNHHKFNNREGDYTITYRITEGNNLFSLLSYPSISSYYQQSPIMIHLKDLWANKRSKFYIAIFQYVILVLYIIIALYLNWRKALLFVVLPQQFAIFMVLVFNYVQHVHADEESAFNHSRNFISPLTDFMLFNNGMHTAHHYRASVHWSLLPETHKKIAANIDSTLIETGFWSYMFKTYLAAPFSKKYAAINMRMHRKKLELQK